MSEVASPEFWRRCSSCKKPINYSAAYFVCSVSTCNRKRIGYVFDSVHCWETHLPGARHRDAAAVEAKAPTLVQWQAELRSDPTSSSSNAGSTSSSSSSSASSGSPAPNSGGLSSPNTLAAEARSPQRVIARPSGSSGFGTPVTSAAKTKFNDALESEILIVVSKLKNYVRERSEMNTSDSVASVLSDRVRRLCDRAIEKARADGRKTLMDRDFEF